MVRNCGDNMLKKIKQLDDELIQKVAKIHTPFLNSFMRTLTFLGDHGKIWAVVWLSISFYRKSLYVLLSILISVLFAFISSEVIIKRIVARVRPCHKIDEELLVLKKIPKFYSFPSSHSASSFAMVLMTSMYCNGWITLAMLILAIGISFSRFYLQAHYLTDVLCGIIIGLICTFLMSRVVYAVFLSVAPEMIV